MPMPSRPESPDEKALRLARGSPSPQELDTAAQELLRGQSSDRTVRMYARGGAARPADPAGVAAIVAHGEQARAAMSPPRFAVADPIDRLPAEARAKLADLRAANEDAGT